MKRRMIAATLALSLGLTTTAALAQGYNAPPGQMNVWGAHIDRPQGWSGGLLAPQRDDAATGVLGPRGTVEAPAYGYDQGY